MAIAIRECGIADRDALVALLDGVLPGWNDVLAPQASGPLAFLTDSTTFVFGAYVDDEPAGIAWGARMRYPNGKIASYLHELDVAEPHRRQGIATMLVGAAMDLARRSGHQKFWLSTGGHNEIAQALYESLGGDRKPRGDVNYWWELS